MSGSRQSTPPSSNSRRPWVVVILGAILVFGLVAAIKLIRDAPEAGAAGAGGGAPKGMPPAAVFVEPITQETTQNEAKVTGSLRAAAQAEVAASEEGAVTHVLVDEGDAVERGAPLANIDARRATTMLAAAEAKLTAATSLVEQRGAELGRTQDDLKMKRALLERKAVSRSDILDAEQAQAVAEAQRDVANDGVKEMRSRIDFLKVQLDDLVVRAPFSGVVTERHVEAGEWVSAGSVVVSLVATDPVEAWLKVPARFRRSVSEKSTNLRVRQSATGDLFEPSKVTVVPEVEPLSQLFTVIATLSNPDGKLTPGESITGIVPAGENAPHWKFSVDALLRGPSGDFVYRASKDGAAERVPLEVAFERDGHVFVTASGGAFELGDQIVIEGNERLQPSQPLMIRVREGAAPAVSP